MLRNKKVLITGGLGFIGSTLAIKLVDLGADVTVLDAMIEGLGGNLFNIEPVKNDIKIVLDDIRNERTMNDIVKGKEYIFHLAGQNDHILSLTNPFPDIDINIKGSAILLETCWKQNKDAMLIYTGTRGEYGPSATLPVTEDAPVNPRGIYELSSLTAQQLFKIYHNNHGLWTVTLRLGNIYGPRAQMKHDRFGITNWFLRRAMEDETVKIFGGGNVLRSFLFVDDAVDAIIKCAGNKNTIGETFNVDSGSPCSIRSLAETMIDVVGKGSLEYVPYTRERALTEPGDIYTDITKITRMTEWRPSTSLRDGICATRDYYMKHRNNYW